MRRNDGPELSRRPFELTQIGTRSGLSTRIESSSQRTVITTSVIFLIMAGMAMIQPLAANAGGGWYLMSPPLSNAGYPDTSQPLNAWHLEKAFDSAKECYAGRWDPYFEKKESVKVLKKHPEVPKKGWQDFLKTEQSELTQAQCIASDDPRLK